MTTMIYHLLQRFVGFRKLESGGNLCP
ncbi:hypothetical protein A2U01_0083936, partial [Trifolium medium]|nr:hypothetical protein [Trifolium medium]